MLKPFTGKLKHVKNVNLSCFKAIFMQIQNTEEFIVQIHQPWIFEAKVKNGFWHPIKLSKLLFQYAILHFLQVSSSFRPSMCESYFGESDRLLLVWGDCSLE